MDFLSEFVIAMQAAGCNPVEPIIANDNRNRVRIEGDKVNQRSGSYQLRIESDFAVGWFRNFREGVTHKWTSRANRSSTPEEKVAWKEKADRERRELAEKLREEHKEAALRAARIWDKAAQHESEPSIYQLNKGITLTGVRYYRGALIIPVKIDGKLTSLQFIAPDGQKRFLRGGEIVGGWFSIAKTSDDFSTIYICEGVSTGASVRAAVNAPVVCAFNAGNLMAVAKKVRARYPDAHVVIAADNDAHLSDNVGLNKAKKAAESINNARVVWAEFGEDKGTDFNDAAQLYGVKWVRDILTTVQSVENEILAEMPDEVPHEFQEPMVFDSQLVGDEIIARTPQRGDFNMRFKVLGYNEGVFYYFPFAARQIVGLTATAHSINNLLQLDNLDAWERRFGGEKISTQKAALFASNAMIELAKKRGVYQQEDRVRGAGVWVDDGNVVFHCGDALYVDGRRMAFEDFDGHYTYVASPKLMSPAQEALGNYDAHRLRKICEAITWENKLSGSLLAGWLVIAPVCAALQYRPHIYITGEAESGKSTVMDRIIKPVLGRLALCVDGKTTEPSIRQRMGYAGRPLVFDEAEPSGNMEGVLDLARLASTGGVVSKFGQPAFNARFAACFSAINPPVTKTADESRMTFMVIKKNRKHTAIQDFDDLVALIDETITEDFCSRMIARTLENMNTLIANIRVFQRAARKITGGARAAQQIGTMLAGLYLLGRTDTITAQQSEDWIAQHDWSEHAVINQIGDPLKLVQYIAGSLLRYGGGGNDMSVGELINMVYSNHDKSADKLLRYYGIAVKDMRVHIASRSQNMSRLLKDTEWKAKWSRTLSDVAGAEKEKSVYFSAGIKTSAVSLPIELFLDESSSWE